MDPEWQIVIGTKGQGGTMVRHFDPLLLAFLRDPASYPHRPEEVHELHTHASLVFVVPPFVYKIKKPVDFGFLDFSTLEKRGYFCRREVELNSRLARGIYLGVEPITREGGGFAFGGAGPVVEYAVKMLRLSADGFLDERIRLGNAGEPELERVAQVLAAFYRHQPSSPQIAEWGRVEKLRISTDENFSQTADFVGKTLTRAGYDAIRAFTDACYEQLLPLFDRRVAEGWIRDCHGDLHLDHIHVTRDSLHIYDCIEFNDRFRHLDIASDAAFLAMDLDFHERPDLGRFLVHGLAELSGDPGMGGLMDFYKCYRAYVRGKVESLQSVSEISNEPERASAADRARRYFQLALQYAVCGSNPIALVFMGRVASGKSTLAESLHRELGWRWISSDTRRKTLAGVPLLERGDPGLRRELYSPRMTELTYDSMIQEARDILSSGQGVILDATFSKRMFRDRLRDALGDTNIRWIVTEVDKKNARERLMLREIQNGVISDARCEDRAILDAAFEEPEELVSCWKQNIQTNASIGCVVQNLLITMASEQPRWCFREPAGMPSGS